MLVSEWLSTELIHILTPTMISSAAAWVFSIYYKAKIEKSIQHKFDVRIENIRADLRKEEENLRAELRAKGDQIAALRSGALSGLASRYAALDKRRFEVLEKVWTSAVKKSHLKTASKMMERIKADPMLEASERSDIDGDKARQFAEIIWKSSGLDKLNDHEWPQTERPFVPPLVWALYSAYSSVLSYAPAQLAAMRSGAGKKILADPQPMLDLVKSAAPQYAAFVDDFGASGLPFLIEQLEDALLAELQKSLKSAEVDHESLERAAEILAAADRLASAIKDPIDQSGTAISPE
ncbi:hypothetical protein [Ancylobacter sp. SL191]|uniref:hypothetical protein n=1 Tax=Ancylobacter sp. SL191 TaxID=2995166 RepID=UPI0022714822|nr:hypothetical protein [Ancylobacter sp. SL191]WAC29245.1 hypothetical protein OU996_09555 [Ancylobacter sp. SL191]